MKIRAENSEIGALYETVQKTSQTLLKEHDESYPLEFRNKNLQEWFKELLASKNPQVSRLGHLLNTHFGSTQTVGGFLTILKELDQNLYNEVEANIDKYVLPVHAASKIQIKV